MNRILSPKEIENYKRYFGINLEGGGSGGVVTLDVVARDLFATLEKRTEERDRSRKDYSETANDLVNAVKDLNKLNHKVDCLAKLERRRYQSFSWPKRRKCRASEHDYKADAQNITLRETIEELKREKEQVKRELKVVYNRREKIIDDYSSMMNDAEIENEKLKARLDDLIDDRDGVRGTLNNQLRRQGG